LKNKIKYTTLKALILSALFVCVNIFSSAQGGQIELVHSDKVTNAIIFPEAVKLTGNVQFKHESRKLFCDSAYFHQTENWVKAYGNVQINQADTLNLFCDSLHFDGNSNIGILRSNVRFRDNEFKMTTDSLEFDANQSIGYYRNWAIINAINQDLSITSKKGYYYSETKTFYFKDSIDIIHPDYNLNADTLEFNTNTETVYFHGPTKIEMDSTLVNCVNGYYDTKNDFLNLYEGATIVDKSTTLYADSLTYNKELEIAEGFYNVSIIDTAENVELKSNYLIKDSDSKIKLTDNARIYKYALTDTLFIRADTIYQQKDTTLNTTKNIAINNVNLINKGIVSICDSLYFNEQDSIIKLRKLPFVWQDSTQLSADSMDVFLLKGSEINKIKLYNNSLVVNKKDSIHYDQLSGNFIIANFKDEAIEQIFIDGNSQTLYYPTNSDKDSTGNETTSLQGQNKLISEQILISFRASEITKIKFIDQPDAQFYPLNKIKEDELYLKNFIWNFSKKPSAVIPK
jgi:lipopolysaccharide export system protein LptA